MENTPENDDHALKSFILDEVLQKQPIFDSYRKLCEFFEHDAMEYPDFEFWFYRFYHGSRDFNYDRKADPKPKTLMDMPVKLMQKIAGNLDPFESVFHEKLEWHLNEKKFVCKPDGNGCTFLKRNRLKMEKSEKNFIKKGLEHLTPIFKMPNLQVNHLTIMVWDPIPELDNLLPASCHVKIALINGYSIGIILLLQSINPKQIALINGYSIGIILLLQSINPKHLVSLVIGGCRERIGREDYEVIFETEQFKTAKHAAFLWHVKFNVEDLVIFRHLIHFQCWLDSDIGPEEILRMRDIFSTFEEFASCDLEFHSTEEIFPMGRFAEALGAEIPIGPLAEGEGWTINHRYKIPKSNDCLEFKITEEASQCRVNIVKIRNGRYCECKRAL
ncbi:hypothetical protein B9Z55_026950 [Caenorhabditis nigoni]|uniref:Mos1 transposase HTH domain-containing protein n=1 Tax=Caenorhabditis nigoni TaxID=1611254 RepID=A0A2G5SI63_9PELO|nr:hypothetical protein B9Z55_026950 [Caenorhabditis nigoni]